MQIQTTAKNIVAAGNDDGPGAAFALLYLIERQVHGADDADIDRVAHRRTLDRQSRNRVGNRERQSVHALLLTRLAPVAGLRCRRILLSGLSTRGLVLRSCPLRTLAARSSAV